MWQIGRCGELKLKRKKKICKNDTCNENKDLIDNADIKITVSPLTLLMFVVFIGLGMTYELACSLCAVILHELSHAEVAKRLGYSFNRIKLMPYGAALCGDENMSAVHEIVIALAGPIFNIVLAVLMSAIWWLYPNSYAFTVAFAKCNVYIGLFNLLPVYPLDGGRVLLAWLKSKTTRSRAYKISRIIAFVVGLSAIVLFGLSAAYTLNFCLLTIGVFMIISALVPDERIKYYSLFSRSNSGERLAVPIEKRTIAVSEKCRLCELCKYIKTDSLTVFEAYNARFECVYKFDEYVLCNMIEKYGYERCVKDCFGEVKQTLDFKA